MHSLVLSCEHAGSEIPAGYVHLFASEAAREALASHRGWDPGALEIAEHLAEQLSAPLCVQRVSRLLVECNRSAESPRLWSEFSRALTPPEREAVLLRHWSAHRSAVRETVARAIGVDRREAAVVHVGVHTFTPVWQGRVRATQVGILYDPRRPDEAKFARRWKAGLERSSAWRGVRVHLNRPYRGWTDGLTTTLRSELSEAEYLGIELEVSQALVPLAPAQAEALARTLASSLAGPSATT